MKKQQMVGGTKPLEQTKDSGFTTNMYIFAK
jgi:hypothetical protein